VSDLLIEWLRTFGALSLLPGLAVVLIFVVAAFLFIPRTFLTIAVGGLYGFSALPLVMLGGTLGSILSFLLARHLFAERVQRWIGRHPRLRVIAAAVDAEGWRIVGLLRFASPTTNSVQNYVFAVTRIGFWPYALASFVFTIPPTALYVYLGAVGRSVLLDDASSPLSMTVTVLAAVCVTGTALLIWRRVRLSVQQAELRHAERGLAANTRG
jgi:uncharacterized membrane protein YdjX (TVP38/TMEM64 family)